MECLLEDLQHLYNFNVHTYIGVVICVLVTLKIYGWLTRPPLPPGPANWKGRLANGDQGLYMKLSEFGKDYDGMFSLRSTEKDFVIVDGFDRFKETFIKKKLDFSSRPRSNIFHFIGLKEPLFSGIRSSLRDEAWKLEKRFIRHTFKLSSSSGGHLEQIMTNEIDRLEKHITNIENQWFCTELAVTNIILSSVISLTSDDYSDGCLLKLHQMLKEWSSLMRSCWIDQFSPPVQKPTKERLERLRSLTETIKELLTRRIDDKQNMTNKNTFNHDVTETFICKQQPVDTETLFSMLFGCFLDSFQVLPASIKWLLLHVTLNKEVQSKVRNEVTKVTGGSRRVTLGDRDVMPYTGAVIMESLRLSSVVPLSYPHAPLWPTLIENYGVSMDIILIANLFAIHRDPVAWPEPEVFRPERHIGNDGELQANEAWVPFCTGNRECVAVELTTSLLFLTLTSLVQNHVLTFPVDRDLQSTSASQGGNLRFPPDFSLTFRQLEQ